MDATDSSSANAQRLIVLNEFDLTRPFYEVLQAEDFGKISAIVLELLGQELKRSFNFKRSEFHAISNVANTRLGLRGLV